MAAEPRVPALCSWPQQRVRRGVIGIVADGGAYLVIRRAAGVAKGGAWCFPGGHVEPGETARRAVVRELREELGIEVRPADRIGAVRVMDSRHILAVWRVEHVGGLIQPDPREIAEVRWLTPVQIRDIRPTLPSNDRVLRMLAAAATSEAAASGKPTGAASDPAAPVGERFGPAPGGADLRA